MNYVFATIVLLVFANQASADIGITHTDTYNQTISVTGIGSGQNTITIPENAIKPFDPASGTLTDVEIRIFGDIVYSGIAAESWYLDPNGTPMFVPYTLGTEYGLDIDGLGGDYFNLDTPVIIETVSGVPGLPGGTPIFGTSSFNFRFDYDELINQTFWGPYDTSCTGCFDYTAPLSMSGDLDGFIDDGSLIDQLNFNLSLSFTNIGQVGAIYPTTLIATSNIYIQSSYIFTPVPVPAAVWLFGSGLIGLIGIARRKKA